jgi:hypothetical protein
LQHDSYSNIKSKSEKGSCKLAPTPAKVSYAPKPELIHEQPLESQFPQKHLLFLKDTVSSQSNTSKKETQNNDKNTKVATDNLFKKPLEDDGSSYVDNESSDFQDGRTSLWNWKNGQILNEFNLRTFTVQTNKRQGPGGVTQMSELNVLGHTCSLQVPSNASADESQCSMRSVSRISSSLPSRKGFKVSNRINLLYKERIKHQSSSCRVDMNEEALLNELQEHYLKKSYCLPEYCLHFAWFLLAIWFLTCSFAIIYYGINIDIMARAEVPAETAEAANSSCPSRALGSASLTVDVPLSSAMDLNLTELEVFTWNQEFTPYPGDPIFPEKLTESWRFIISSILSWLLGIFVLSIVQSLAYSMLVALYYYNEMKSLMKTINSARSSMTGPFDFDTAQAIFLLLLYPKVLLDMSSSYDKSGKGGI